ncbi:hypothetical protein Pyn_31638 [Prunus yedoensis var. nudiflora]|uniref:Uncharacterized protein n=1 Tax=Prunus yedoensis var. nudiflora TaxID=2094558 RepID=A0A314UYC0_PRUYE|nr:hypothetical protein Pyn_31638 [Prunus yedoensis var. nudiflora]
MVQKLRWIFSLIDWGISATNARELSTARMNAGLKHPYKALLPTVTEPALQLCENFPSKNRETSSQVNGGEQLQSIQGPDRKGMERVPTSGIEMMWVLLPNN